VLIWDYCNSGLRLRVSNRDAIVEAV
jgi:hypothetical protein